MACRELPLDTRSWCDATSSRTKVTDLPGLTGAPGAAPGPAAAAKYRRKRCSPDRKFHCRIRGAKAGMKRSRNMTVRHPSTQAVTTVNPIFAPLWSAAPVGALHIPVTRTIQSAEIGCANVPFRDFRSSPQISEENVHANKLPTNTVEVADRVAVVPGVRRRGGRRW